MKEKGQADTTRMKELYDEFLPTQQDVRRKRRTPKRKVSQKPTLRSRKRQRVAKYHGKLIMDESTSLNHDWFDRALERAGK